VVLVIKLLVLVALWWAFVRDQRVEVKAEQPALPWLSADTPSPDGHPKLPHLWPVKLPQARRSNYDVSGLRAMRAAASLSR
jgi:hypothetical protein